MIDITIVNQVIHAMCQEVRAMDDQDLDWRLLTEDELLYEAAVCIFGSQTIYETAVAAADRLRHAGLLRPRCTWVNRTEYITRVLEELSPPLVLLAKDGSVRWVRPRFKNRMASLLTTTLDEIYGNSCSIRSLLLIAQNAKKARKVLIHYISGFGPKQTSLFLRRIGYCDDLAVLDTHLLDYLSMARGISLSSSKLSSLSSYEKAEDMFREIAAEFGYSLGCVDLATWLTMRVAKREAYL